MAYDPYGGQLPEQQMDAGSIAGDLALAPLRPSTYLYGYLWPGAFSNKKGIMTPFETRGSKWKEEFSNIKNSFKAGKSKGIKSIWGSAQRLGPFGPGHRILVGNVDKLNELKIKQSRYIISGGNAGNASRMASMRLNEAVKLKDSLWNDFKSGEYYKSGPGKMRETYNKQALGVRREINSLDTRISRLNILAEGRGKQLAVLSKEIKFRTLAKWGIRAGKAGSLIGAGMLAWDLASVVAAPLAQAGMTALNAAANAYQSRYMPEMGGQLQLSYLSQGAATERQRAISAISKAYINGRSSFGSEGSMMHS